MGFAKYPSFITLSKSDVKDRDQIHQNITDQVHRKCYFIHFKTSARIQISYAFFFLKINGKCAIKLIRSVTGWALLGKKNI